MDPVRRGARQALHRLDDERLARLSGVDRAGAFATLYARHHQALYRYCATIVRDEADAQDALQATWLRALLALRRGQRDAPLRPWLFRIAHNESVSILRRRARGREPTLVPVGVPCSAEDGVIARERFAQVVDDLRALPERARSALVMRELTGLSHEEIARALDITVAAARQSIYEARRGLEEEARGRAMACGEIQLRVSDGDRRVLRGRAVRAHIRHCPDCAAFAAAIDDRREALRAFAPGLGVVASGAILARVLGAGSGGAAVGGAAVGGAAGGGVGAVGGGVGAAGTATGIGGATGVAAKALGAGLLAKSLAAASLAATAAGITVAVSAGGTHDHRAGGRGPRAASVAASTIAAASPAAPALAAALPRSGSDRPRAAADRTAGSRPARAAPPLRRAAGRAHGDPQHPPGRSPLRHHGIAVSVVRPPAGQPSQHGHGRSAAAHGAVHGHAAAARAVHGHAAAAHGVHDHAGAAHAVHDHAAAARAVHDHAAAAHAVHQRTATARVLHRRAGAAHALQGVPGRSATAHRAPAFHDAAAVGHGQAAAAHGSG